MSSVADSKWSEEKEEHLLSCQSRRTNADVERNFKNLLGKSAKVIDKPILKFIHNQLDTKLRQFIQGELDVVIRKIKNSKAASLDKIPPKVWKTRKFDDLLLWYCNAVYDQSTIGRWAKFLLLPQEKWPRNYKELSSYNS